MSAWTHTEALLEVGTAGQYGHAKKKLRNRGAVVQPFVADGIGPLLRRHVEP
jgi:hypothetical protein